MTFLAGQKVTAAQLNEPLSAWSAYTPALTGLSLGNGTRVGRYKRIGQTVHAEAHVIFGSTTSVSGSIKLGLPVSAAFNEIADGYGAVGAAYLLDSGTRRYVGAVVIDTADRVSIQHSESGGLGFVNATNPFTWATSDAINLSITYKGRVMDRLITLAIRLAVLALIVSCVLYVLERV